MRKLRTKKDWNRIQLFEFGDLAFFPRVLRDPMTGVLQSYYSLSKFEDLIVPVLERLLDFSNEQLVVDLCSGAGGPMPSVVKKIRAKRKSVQLVLTDLYPNIPSLNRYNDQNDFVRYEPTPVDATEVPEELIGIRTLIASFHHLNEERAMKVLKSAQEERQSIAIIEPFNRNFIGFLLLLPSFLMPFLIIPFVKPRRLSNFFFTYLVPLIPLSLFWDGWVSYLRIYRIKELQQLLDQLPETKGYRWETSLLGIQKSPCLVGYSVQCESREST